MQSEEIIKRSAVDATAARVTSSPSNLFRYESKKKIVQLCSDVPLPTKPITQQMLVGGQFVDLRGELSGRLTVIGLSATTGKTRSAWVCRCSCGNYVHRSSKSLKNKTDGDDCCEYCRELRQIKRKDEFNRIGRHRPK